jgi:hypothetical protein
MMCVLCGLWTGRVQGLVYRRFNSTHERIRHAHFAAKTVKQTGVVTPAAQATSADAVPDSYFQVGGSFLARL